jgi:hypothetical protein
MTYTEQNTNGYVWYRRTYQDPPSCEYNPEGCNLRLFCDSFIEEHEDQLIKYAQKMDSSPANIQQNICVQLAGLCKKDDMVNMAKAVIAEQQKQMAAQKNKLSGGTEIPSNQEKTKKKTKKRKNKNKTNKKSEL